VYASDDDDDLRPLPLDSFLGAFLLVFPALFSTSLVEVRKNASASKDLRTR
jgi:hypothetical protein